MTSPDEAIGIVDAARRAEMLELARDDASGRGALAISTTRPAAFAKARQRFASLGKGGDADCARTPQTSDKTTS